MSSALAVSMDYFSVKQSRTGWDDALPAVGSLLHFAQDREIYGEGADAEIFYKVISGVVRTCKYLADGRRQIDAFYVAGDLFGIEADSEYSFSAEAVCDCSLASYRRQGLEKLAGSNNNLSHQLFSHAIRSLARAQDHSLLLGRKTALERVAAFLVDWAQRSSTIGMAALVMTRQDIADYLGLTIETVSRTLSQLERDTVIEFSTARQIRFKDYSALCQLNG